MKKRLEADLISIAHRILQIKDKSEIDQLYLETQKLYEKLSVLKFIKDNYGDVQPTIGSYSEIEKEIEHFYDKSTLPAETVIETTENNLHQSALQEEEIKEVKEEVQQVAAPEKKEELIKEDIKANSSTIQTPTEEKKIDEEIVAEKEPSQTFKPAFKLTPKSEIEEDQKTEAVQVSIEDLLGTDYNEPQFVKVEDVAATNKNIVPNAVEKTETAVQKPKENTVKIAEKAEPKSVSLNDKFSKGIDIDLNDRIAFVKHLFGNSNEDYSRVMNQLITYDNFYETKNFIDEMVKPDYNDWKGKEEYEERFMEIIEKKFL